MSTSRLLVWAATLCTALSTHAVSNRCVDFYKQVEIRVQRTSQYEKDFGAGVFVRKVTNEEFKIEPPLEIATSIRQAHLAVGRRSQSGEKRMTVLFGGFSEGEVTGFRAMLIRDSKIKEDEALTSVLLNDDIAPGLGYDGIRDRALVARDRMNRRYDWDKATIENKTSATADREERYLLTARHDGRPEEFLLKIRLRVAAALKSRVAQIRGVLVKPTLVNATSEQIAHEMMVSLKQNDPGVTAVTLKVVAGDFVIADNR